MLYTIIRGDTTTITLDCVQQFSESHSATVTQHPVETGAAITDHVFLNNTELNMKGVVSDFSPSPEYITMSSLGSGTPVTGDRSHTTEIKELLMSIFRNREVITIQISTDKLSDFNQFENCVLTSIGFSDDPEAGEAIYPDLKFSQLRVVSKTTRKESAVPVVLNSQVQQAKGDTKAASDAANATTIANKSNTIGALKGESLKQYAQDKANSRSLDLGFKYPDMSQQQIYSQIEKETGQTLSDTGTITAGWTEKNSIGQPRTDIQKAVSKGAKDANEKLAREVTEQLRIANLKGQSAQESLAKGRNNLTVNPILP